MTQQSNTNGEPLRVGYLVGTSYCGSTLMAFLLDDHPYVVSVGETTPNLKIQRKQSFDLPCSCGEKIIDCPFWQELSERIQKTGTDFSLHRWENEYSYRSPLMNKLIRAHTTGPVTDALVRFADSFLPYHRTRIAHANRANVEYIRAALEIANAKAFFDTSKGIPRLRRLMACPELDLRIIHFTRDARAFAFHGKRNDVPIDDMTNRWLAFHQHARRLLSKVDPQRVITIKYEDLCSDPQRWLGAIHEHLGLKAAPPPTTLKSEDHHIIGNRMRLAGEFKIQLNEAWRDGLTQTETDRALSIAGTLNRELGYE